MNSKHVISEWPRYFPQTDLICLIGSQVKLGTLPAAQNLWDNFNVPTSES